MNRPWFAIAWFAIWGLFQAYAVSSVFAGTWQRPKAFSADAYFSLIYPDMFFIPLYLLAAGLLLRAHWMGSVVAFVAGGGIIYVMIYLLALSGLSGATNLIADGTFLVCTLVSLWQVGSRARPRRAVNA
ncbi:MAG: hypothetical protein ACRELZ_27080 [Candidatus Rokuibacteriota bacterium]